MNARIESWDIMAHHHELTMPGGRKIDSTPDYWEAVNLVNDYQRNLYAADPHWRVYKFRRFVRSES